MKFPDDRVTCNGRHIVAALSLLLLCGVVSGEERLTVCATYSSTGKNYKVDAIKASGSELNSATHSMDYDIFSQYIVIFWKQGEATIIDLGSLPTLAFGASGKDQEGRDWQVTTSTAFCF